MWCLIGVASQNRFHCISLHTLVLVVSSQTVPEFLAGRRVLFSLLYDDGFGGRLTAEVTLLVYLTSQLQSLRGNKRKEPALLLKDQCYSEQNTYIQKALSNMTALFFAALKGTRERATNKDKDNCSSKGFCLLLRGQ